MTAGVIAGGGPRKSGPVSKSLFGLRRTRIGADLVVLRAATTHDAAGPGRDTQRDPLSG